MSPPFRDKKNQDDLWNGLRAGSLQVVATDHCAFTTKQKEFGLGRLHQDSERHRRPRRSHAGALDLWRRHGPADENEFVAVTSTNIARILNLYPRKGAILPGAEADIVVWDPKASKTISADKQLSVIDYNVFEGDQSPGPAALHACRAARSSIADGKVTAEQRPRQIRPARAVPGRSPRAREDTERSPSPRASRADMLATDRRRVGMRDRHIASCR